MKKLEIIVILIMLANSIYSQNGWTLKVTTDDYTMAKEYKLIYSDEKGTPIASYFPHNGALLVFKLYDGRTYFDECFNAMMDNGGRIEPWSTVVKYRFVKGNDFQEYEDTGIDIIYCGLNEDSRIDTKGFYSVFRIFVSIEDMKKYSFLNLRHYDSITKKIIISKISLAGFTKTYSKLPEECKQ